MALKQLVISADKRILINRFLKDFVTYFFLILITGILVFVESGMLEGTQYAVYAAIILMVVRVILKAVEPYHSTEQFVWFWQKIMEIVKEILPLLKKPVK